MNIFWKDKFECLKNHENREITYGKQIERYEPQVNTSTLYKTYNLPERFENTRKCSNISLHFVIQFRNFNKQTFSLVLVYKERMCVHFIEHLI